MLEGWLGPNCSSSSSDMYELHVQLLDWPVMRSIQQL